MAISIITDLPGAQVFSKQPLPIVLHTSMSVSDASLRIRLRVYLVDGVTNPVVDIDEKPDSNGNCYFDIAGLLDDFMDEPVVSFASSLTITRKAPTFFALDAYEVNSTTTTIRHPWGNPFNGDGDLIPPFVAYSGGMSYQKRKFAYYFDYAQHTDSGFPPFLTWKPNNIKVTWDQVEALSYILYADAPVSVKVEAFKQDGTSLGEQLIMAGGPFSKYDTIYFSVNPGQVKSLYFSEGSTIAYYDIYLADVSTQISEKRRYYIDTCAYRWTKVFGFKNSLSGYDKIYIRGQWNNLGNYSSTQVQVFEPSFPSAQLPEYGNLENLGTNLFTGSLSTAEMRWMRDFFLSTRKFEILRGDVLPITLDNSNQQAFIDEREPVKPLSFTYNHAFSNAVWTPEEYEAVPTS